MSFLYPIFLDLSGKRVLVAGAGEVALRKIEALLDCSANVVVVAPQACSGIRRLAEDGAVSLFFRPFQPDDLEGSVLAIAATSDESVNRSVFESCRRRGIPCNVVDEPDLCDFHVPALVRRGEIAVAISTGGRAPAFAGRMKREIESAVGERHAIALEAVHRLRARLKSDPCLDSIQRGEILRLAVDSDRMDDFLSGRSDELDLEGLS